MNTARSLQSSIWFELWKDVKLRICLLILLVLTLGAIFIPEILPAHYADVSENQFSPPSLQHPFGTDFSGRDLFYQVFSGARVSLLVGLAGAIVALFIGTAYGLISGYAGGKIDTFMMRLVEVFYSIPRVIFILISINTFDNSLKEFLFDTPFESWISHSRIIILILSLGLIEWLTMARIIRGQVLQLKEQQFITASKALGQSHFRILLKHLLPNLSGIIIIYLTLTVPAVILDESFLSFLGLGVQAPQSSWGSLLSIGADAINPIRFAWWLVAFPAIAMSLALLALNFLGDGLRDLLDPRSRK